MSPADLIRAWSKAVRAFAEMDARKALHAWADANPDTGTHCEHCGTTGCAVCGVAA